MIIRSLSIPLVVVTALMAGCSAMHGSRSSNVKLTGAEEVPSVTTSATGTGEITVSADRVVSGTVVVNGMQPTVAHIHAGAPGQNGPPIITLNKSGSNTFVIPTGATLSEAQKSEYKAGNLYLNVHSASYPNGEIRAQLKPHMWH